MYRIFLLLFFAAQIQAQNPFTLAPNPSEGFGVASDNFFNANAELFNDTDSTILFKWERILEDMPTGWKSSVCLNITCLPPDQTTGEFTLDAGYSMAVNSTFYPNDVAGAGEVKLKIWVKNDTTQSTVQSYFGNADATSTLSRSVEKSYKLYPNPTPDVFSITSNFDFSAIEIYNTQGRSVEVFKSGDVFYIGHLPTNLYFVHILSEQKEILTVLKLLKL
ncbi:MAG: T9SS type A sorting domain-containing protein [Bacteroidota bacterium]